MGPLLYPVMEQNFKLGNSDILYIVLPKTILQSFQITNEGCSNTNGIDTQINITAVFDFTRVARFFYSKNFYNKIFYKKACLKIQKT